MTTLRRVALTAAIAALIAPAVARATLDPISVVPEYPAAPSTPIGSDPAVGAPAVMVYGSGCSDPVGQIRTSMGQEKNAGAKTVTYGVVSVDSGACTGDTFARITVDLPPNVSFAISPSSPVECFAAAHNAWSPLN